MINYCFVVDWNFLVLEPSSRVSIFTIFVSWNKQENWIAISVVSFLNAVSCPVGKSMSQLLKKMRKSLPVVHMHFCFCLWADLRYSIDCSHCVSGPLSTQHHWCQPDESVLEVYFDWKIRWSSNPWTAGVQNCSGIPGRISQKYYLIQFVLMWQLVSNNPLSHWWMLSLINLHCI